MAMSGIDLTSNPAQIVPNPNGNNTFKTPSTIRRIRLCGLGTYEAVQIWAIVRITTG